MTRAYFFGSGPATALPGGLYAFLKTQAQSEAPDIELIFRGAPPDAGMWFPGLKCVLTAMVSDCARACFIPKAGKIAAAE